MTDSELNDILTFLMVAVFADKRIYASEVDVFVKSVSRIKLSENTKPLPSETQALLWFEMNKDAIKAKFDLPRSEFDAWFMPILKNVGKNSDRDALTHLLEMIFRADGEVHVSETALMSLVKRQWGL